MKTTIWVCLFAVVLESCGIVIPATQNESELSEIQVRDPMSTVRLKMGEPDVVRGSLVNVNGQTVTVWQYQLFDKGAPVRAFFLGILTLGIGWFIPFNAYSTNYWLYFVDGKLAQWGQAGDWQPDFIEHITIQKE